MKLSDFTQEQLQDMLKAVIKTRQQYIDGIAAETCPLCEYRLKATLTPMKRNWDCDYCPHFIFNGERCYGWLEKNSSFEEFEDIFTSKNAKTIIKKCIARLNGWEKKIRKEIEDLK